jgi:hypothetical protein
MVKLARIGAVLNMEIGRKRLRLIIVAGEGFAHSYLQ